METIKNKKPHKRSNHKNSINSYINLLYRKIHLFEESGEYEEAILCYDKILEMYPNDEHALLWKNNLINLQGKSMKHVYNKHALRAALS